MHGNMVRVSQEKPVLLRDNSIFTPHNSAYQGFKLANAIFCKKNRLVISGYLI